MDFVRKRCAAVCGASLWLVALTGIAGAQALPTDNINIAAASRGARILNTPTMLDNQKEYAADNLLDGKVYGRDGKGTFGWVSNRYDPINMEEVIIGFKDNAIKTIGRIVINPSSYVARERWAKDIALEVSSDSVEGPYTSVSEITLKQSPENQEFRFLPVQARFVKLRLRTNYGSDRAVALGEVEIYESIRTDDPMGNVIARLETGINDLEKVRKSQSELGTGAPSPSIPGTAGVPNSTVNMAASSNGGKVVAFSSVFESERGKGPDRTYTADKLIDGRLWKQEEKPSNGWSSQGFVPGQQWVILGFKDDRTQPIGKIVVNPLSYQPRDRWARRIEVQVSTESYKNENDLKSFRTIKTLNLRTDPVNQEFDLGAIEAKYVRLVFTANGPGGLDVPGIDPDINSDRAVALGEVEIYPPRVAGTELDAVISQFKNVVSDLKNLRRRASSIAEAPDATPSAEPVAEEEPASTTKSVPQVTAAPAVPGTRIKTAQTPTKRP